MEVNFGKVSYRKRLDGGFPLVAFKYFAFGISKSSLYCTTYLLGSVVWKSERRLRLGVVVIRL